MARPNINLMAVGDAGCGKTCLCMRFSKNQFLGKQVPVHLQNGDAHIENEDLDIDDNQVVECDFGRDGLKLSYFNSSGETFVTMARLYGDLKCVSLHSLLQI